MSLLSRVPFDNRFVTWTDWDGYLRFYELVADRRVKVTYDRGTLELLTPSKLHERAKEIIGALVECLLDEADVEFEAGGSTTFRKKALDRGLEPDKCFWIRSAAQARQPEDDTERYPCPDLAIEVDITRSALDRLGIYAALGVGEIWRWRPEDGGTLHVHLLTQPAVYEDSLTSRLFSWLDIKGVEQHIRLGLSDGHLKAVRAFRAWVRSRLDPR